MKFLLQKEFKNEAFITLQRAQDFHCWKNNGKDVFEIEFTRKHPWEQYTKVENNPKDWCPVGSVEFVHNYYKEHFGLELKPINVPEELFPFAGRNILNMYPEMRLGFTERMYIKTNDIEKWSNNGVYDWLEFKKFLIGNYQVSEIINIESEWRCFVYNGKLLSPHFYQGNPWLFPCIEDIQNMIKNYKNCLSCYTLDVIIHKNKYGYKTSVLEVHDFYACGLYGFQDLDKLPFMYWRSHLDKINRFNLAV